MKSPPPGKMHALGGHSNESIECIDIYLVRLKFRRQNPPLLDSSYHIRMNVSVRRGIV